MFTGGYEWVIAFPTERVKTGRRTSLGRERYPYDLAFGRLFGMSSGGFSASSKRMFAFLLNCHLLYTTF